MPRWALWRRITVFEGAPSRTASEAGSLSVAPIFDHTDPIHSRPEAVNGPAALHRLTYVAEPFAGGKAHVIHRDGRSVREESREVTMAKSAACDAHNRTGGVRDQKIL